jgi:3',5'-cyclic AMP phosphodiesterase CpdA
VTRRGLPLAATGAGALVAVAAAVVVLRAAAGPALLPLPPASLSLLAVGDTGDPPGWLPVFDGQTSVAFGLEREDRRARADGLVLLGDNFYFHGLREEELVDRVRGNLVAPFCHFVELAGPRSREVADGCRPSREGAPARIFAVLGNHDIRAPESAKLETQAVPEFVSNWTLPAAKAKVFELAGGVSLVLFDSNHLGDERDPAPLRQALREARGPWRILAAHHPVGTSRDTGYREAARVGRYGALVRSAIEEAGVPVQLMLAGHEHSLQAIELPAPGPHLMIVSGAGSRPNPVKTSSRGRRFAREGLGFVRIDLVEEPEAARLVVTLFAAPLWRSLAGIDPEPVARWSVTADGEVRAEPFAAVVVEPS